jgi:hypothetical protein
MTPSTAAESDSPVRRMIRIAAMPRCLRGDLGSVRVVRAFMTSFSFGGVRKVREANRDDLGDGIQIIGNRHMDG